MINSAGILIKSKDKILLCHATYIKELEGTNKLENNRWGIPKGKIDDGETPYQAALRETLEETGLDLKQIGILPDNKIYKQLNYKSVKKEKTLYVFLVEDSLGVLQNKKLSCSTLVTNTNYPENDDFVWIEPNKAKSIIYRSQLKLLENI